MKTPIYLAAGDFTTEITENAEVSDGGEPKRAHLDIFEVWGEWIELL
jgi:hypothetical protein